MLGECLKGLGALQHLKDLVLIGNLLRTAEFLHPLPSSLTALRVQGGYGEYPTVDCSAAFRQQAQHAESGSLPCSSNGPMPGSGLLSLNIVGQHLHQPSVLSCLTSLSALHTFGLHSSKPRELLAVLPGLSKLQHLDLSIVQSLGSYSNDVIRHGAHVPCCHAADLERLVSGCRDLEWLSIAALPMPALTTGYWQRSVEVPEPCSLLALQGATRLACLPLHANQHLQDSHLAELATLTTLRSLEIIKIGFLRH